MGYDVGGDLYEEVQQLQGDLACACAGIRKA